MLITDPEIALAEGRTKARPAVALTTTDAPAASRIGGAPDLDPATPWPMRAGQPLAFLVQLDRAALCAAGAPDWLPGDACCYSSTT